MALSVMQEMAIRDINGNCRCPFCGKYRKRSDLLDQDPHIYFGDENVQGHIHVPPGCIYCFQQPNQSFHEDVQDKASSH